MRLTSLCAAAVVMVLAGCVAAHPSVASTASPPPNYVVATRSAVECTAVIDSVRAGQLRADSPRPKTMTLPPSSPASVRGQKATLVMQVDATGRTSRDNTTVTGIQDVAYGEQLRKMGGQMQFWPSVVNGCAVPATAHLDMTL